MKSLLTPAIAMGLCAGAAHADIIYSEDFEETGVADGAFAVTWQNTDFVGSSTTTRGNNLLNPAATGGTSAWLNPVPAELGEIFGVIHSGFTVTGDTGLTFTAGLDYTFTFTQFRRDDVGGDSVQASIGNTAGALASEDFAAITATDTFVTRTVNYTATGADDGQTIVLRFVDISATENTPQVGIDNIVLTAVPEPSSLALLGLGGLLAVRRRRG